METLLLKLHFLKGYLRLWTPFYFFHNYLFLRKKLGILVWPQWWSFEDKEQIYAEKSIPDKYFLLQTFTYFQMRRQKFGTVSENKVLRKWKLSKNVNNKCSPKLILKSKTFKFYLTLKIGLESQIDALFDDLYESRWYQIKISDTVSEN